MRELAELVIDKVGGPSTLVRAPLPADDPRRRQPDIGRAEALLGWQPTVALSEGLDHTIAYFRERPRTPGQRVSVILADPKVGAGPAD